MLSAGKEPLGRTVQILIRLYDVLTGPLSRNLTRSLMISKQNLHVLVVEDEELVANSIEGILEFAGHQTQLVTDLSMPGMKGDALAAAIRARAPAQRIILMTGIGHLFRNTDAPVAADLILSKPFEMDELLATIARLFGTESSSG